VAGPTGTFICTSCVELSQKLLGVVAAPPPKPSSPGSKRKKSAAETSSTRRFRRSRPRSRSCRSSRPPWSAFARATLALVLGRPVRESRRCFKGSRACRASRSKRRSTTCHRAGGDRGEGERSAGAADGGGPADLRHRHAGGLLRRPVARAHSRARRCGRGAAGVRRHLAQAARRGAGAAGSRRRRAAGVLALKSPRPSHELRALVTRVGALR